MNFLNRFKIIADNDRYYPAIIFILSVFILSFQLGGSMGSWDESIYSEVAKEGVASGNWVEMFDQGVIWLEKPPLAIWLTMISYKIFGINDVSSRFFPVVFGVVGILAVYYLAKRFFNSQVGLLSSFVLLTTPYYIFMSRSNMMDIFLVTFVVLSFLFFLRSFQDKKNLLLSALFFGLAFMSKNVAALIYIPLFFVYMRFKKDFSILRSKFFVLSILVFFAVVLPWHLAVWFKHGDVFVEQYFGFHMARRFTENILGVPYAYDNFYYLKTFLLRSASWCFVFISLLPVMYTGFKNGKDSNKLRLLFFWIFLVLIFFTVSVTKLYHYIFPVYVPFSILIGYSLYQSIKSRSVLIVLAVGVIFLNMFPFMINNVSDFGEVRLLIPKLLIVTKLPLAILFSLVAVVITYFVLKFLKGDYKYSKLLLFLIFVFSVLLPFSPDRAPAAVKANQFLLENGAEKVYLYKTHSLANSLIFYGFPKYKVFIIGGDRGGGIRKIDGFSSEKTFCVIGNNDPANSGLDLFPCYFEASPE